MPRTDKVQGWRRHRIGGWLARRLQLRSERGAALVEAAIVFPVLFTIVLGSLEYGLMFKDSLTVSNATRAGARVGSIDGNNAYTDYDIINAAKSSLSAVSATDVQYLIVFKATPTGVGLAPASAPSATCLSTAAGLGGGTGGVSGSCNIYTGTWLTNTFPSVAKTAFGTCSGSPDASWCAPTRQVLQSGSTAPDGGPDYVGIYVKITHKALTGLVTNNKALSDTTVQRIEPH